MKDNLSDEQRYQLGLKLGSSLVGIFKVLADLEDLELNECIELWIESYISDQLDVEHNEGDL